MTLCDYAAKPAPHEVEAELSCSKGQIIVADTRQRAGSCGSVDTARRPDTELDRALTREMAANYVRQSGTEEGVPPVGGASAANDYAALLESYDGATARRSQQHTEAQEEEDEEGSVDSHSTADEKSEIDVYFDVETADGLDSVCVSVRRTETMQDVAERVAAAVGTSRAHMCELMELDAGSERRTVAEASPSLSLSWRQALTDEDNRFVVPRIAAPVSPSGQEEPGGAAGLDSLEHGQGAVVSESEEQRAQLSAQLRHAKAELAKSSLRCTELQTECLGFQSEFVGMSRDNSQLSVDHKRLTELCRQQAERLHHMTLDCDAMRTTVLQAHTAIATVLSAGKVMEQLQDELSLLQCALGDSVNEQTTLSPLAGTAAASAPTPTLDHTAGSRDTRSLEEEMSALQSEHDQLQVAWLRGEEEHTHRMRPTAVTTTMVASLVDAVRSVTRATARGSQLSDVERRYRALQQELAELSAAYTQQQHEKDTFRSQLAALAAAEVEAVAAKSATEGALEHRIGALREASEAQLADANAQVAAAVAERDGALGRIVVLEDELSTSVKEVSVLEVSLAASREQLAGMYKAVETQHWGVVQLNDRLKQTEQDEKHTRTLLDASVEAAEQQRASFGVELAELHEELARVTEEAQLSEVALTAAMDVVEECRSKLSATDWRAITAATQPQPNPL